MNVFHASGTVRDKAIKTSATHSCLMPRYSRLTQCSLWRGDWKNAAQQLMRDRLITMVRRTALEIFTDRHQIMSWTPQRTTTWNVLFLSVLFHASFGFLRATFQRFLLPHFQWPYLPPTRRRNLWRRSSDSITGLRPLCTAKELRSNAWSRASPAAVVVRLCPPPPSRIVRVSLASPGL